MLLRGKCKWLFFALGLMVPLLCCMPAQAGNLQPPGPPGSTMYTLEAIYDLIDSTYFPIDRFRDNEDGTVFDTRTGLTWTQSANLGGVMSHSEAVDYCSSLALGGYGDWRLPTRDELHSFAGPYDKGGLSGVLGEPEVPFINIEPSVYWTGTLYQAQNYWTVHLYDGLVSYDSMENAFYVWPVRNGQ